MIKRNTATGLHTSRHGETVSYCPKCLEFKIKSRMGARLYLDEDGNVVPPKPDAHLWRQCGRCGHILPIYNLKTEGRLTTQLVPSTDPFHDRGEPRTLSPKGRLGKTGRGKKNEWDFVADPDIKQELRQGSQLISYSEF